MKGFALSKLDTATIEQIAAHYYNVASDAHLFSESVRGPIRRRGYLEMDELVEIVRWKAERMKTVVQRNTPEQIQMVTRHAFATTEPRLAAWVLRYLTGVHVRMASAILTVFDPETYTVLDVRAWSTLRKLDLRSLGVSVPDDFQHQSLNSCETYGLYLRVCQQLAQQFHVSLRTLDRCLFALRGRDWLEVTGSG